MRVHVTMAFATLNTFSVLPKYEHVTNSLACVLRTFRDIYYLLYINCLVTLLLTYSSLGIHAVQPLLVLKYKNNTSDQKFVVLRKSVIGDNLTNIDA